MEPLGSILEQWTGGGNLSKFGPKWPFSMDFLKNGCFFGLLFFSNFASLATAGMDLKPILNINLSYWYALNPIWDL